MTDYDEDTRRYGRDYGTDMSDDGYPEPITDTDPVRGRDRRWTLPRERRHGAYLDPNRDMLHDFLADESREPGRSYEREYGRTPTPRDERSYRRDYGGETQSGPPREPGRERPRDYRRREPERVSFAGRGPKGWSRADERIREDVCEYLTDHPDLDASDVDVVVATGFVTLSGFVPDRQAKRLAEDVATQVAGVKDVHNTLRVKTPLN